MAVNTRFATGVHVLILLASEPEKVHTSKGLARSLKTNPVVVRRILSSLQCASLVACQRGPRGGSRLAKHPKAIKLSEIYKAVESNPLFYTLDISGAAVAKVNSELDKVFKVAKSRVVDQLKEQSLYQILREVKMSGRARQSS